MIKLRCANERGHTILDWLDSYHTFSFDWYYDPDWIGFRSLRVINEDRVQPGQGFGTHSHRDMEILTYLLEGALEHKDSSGAGSVIHPGELQRMSAGTGIAHSEYNHSGSDIVHFLQIWLLPERKGLKPGYQQQKFRREEMHGKLLLIADRDGRNGGVTVHQDVYLYAALLEPGQKITHPLEPGRHAWLQVARGAVALNGSSLNAGDGAAVSQEVILEIDAKKMSEILLFDLA